MNDLLQQGITAFKAGNRDEARKFFIAAIKQDRDNEHAWQYMYNVATDDKERLLCLQQILRINPRNEKANALFNRLRNAELQIQPQVNNPSTQVASLKKNAPIAQKKFKTKRLFASTAGATYHRTKQKKKRKKVVQT